MISQDTNIIAAFSAAINRHDVAAMADLMTEDHTFVDSWGRPMSGRKEMVAAWTRCRAPEATDTQTGREICCASG